MCEGTTDDEAYIVTLETYATTKATSLVVSQ